MKFLRYPALGLVEVGVGCFFLLLFFFLFHLGRLGSGQANRLFNLLINGLVW
jgi:hypothetical protein